MNPSERGPVLRRTDKGFLPAVDDFAEESHIALTSDAGHQVSVLGTPADLEAFALGHALAEGVGRSRGSTHDHHRHGRLWTDRACARGRGVGPCQGITIYSTELRWLRRVALLATSGKEPRRGGPNGLHHGGRNASFNP